MYIVGTDIEPGTYKSSGQDGCYWVRMGDFSGNSILENDNANGQAIVTITATDRGFRSSRCGTWTLI